MVGLSQGKSDHDYNYKTDFQIWKNKEFERKIISRSWRPLESTPVGKKTPDSKISPLELTPVGAETFIIRNII